MGKLSMNPDNPGLETGQKLAHQIADQEEWGGTPGVGDEDEEDNFKDPPQKKMKFLSYELNISYAKTLPGIIRILQMLLLFIAFISVVITSKWPDQGTYSFFCVFLVISLLISSYLFFTVLAGTREEKFCGFSWILVELIYFGLFGFLIFIGSCLAASKAGGASGLTASAVFGFGAVITYVYYFWITWKLRKAKPTESNTDKENKNAEDWKEKEDEEESNVIHQQSNLEAKRHELPLRNASCHSSMPTNFDEQLYANEVSTFKEKGHRRRHSVSDKDSAYSEGSVTPTRGKVIPPKMRRTASAFSLDGDYDHVLQKQPLAHISHRPYGNDLHSRRLSGDDQRIGYGYPHELATRSFRNMGYKHDGSRYRDDDPRRAKRNSIPEWLRAALGNDVGPESNIVDSESEAVMPNKRSLTIPSHLLKEFPLLNTSDEESINYPSVSQNGMGKQFNSLPSQNFHSLPNGAHGMHRHHHGKKRRGRIPHRCKKHLHRKPNNHHHRQKPHNHDDYQKPHIHHRNYGGKHREAGGRRLMNGAHEDYLRQMMENDELVMNESLPEKDLRGFQPHRCKPIHTGNRRVIPEQPISIQFPEYSRWDDEIAGHHPNPLMEKYIKDSQKMRS